MTMIATIMTSFMLATIPLPTGMVKGPLTEIASMLAVEHGTIVLIVNTVAIMALPCGIRIISVSGVIPFRYAELGFDMDL